MLTSPLPLACTTRITYYKRFRMELDLDDLGPARPLPDGYCWVHWDDQLLELHADVTYRCFRGEIDASIFPCFRSHNGCARLMQEIRRKPGFLPEATWLAASFDGHCATVQGICDRNGLGAIQNLGVLPCHRGLGVGKALLLRALDGFRRAGLRRAYLEVTAQNDAAVQMYHQIGFRRRKTVYKAVEVPES